MAKTVVGLFNSREEAREVINDLANAGFDRNSISLMARGEKDSWTREEGEHETEGGALEGAAKGAAIGGGIGLVVGLVALAIPGVGPIIAAGPLATALTGLGVGAAAGGLIGALANIGVPEEHASYYAEGVRRGGTLVTVSTEDRTADRAAAVMRTHGAVDIEKHAAGWKERGWGGRFDESSSPLSDEELAREREYYSTGTRTMGDVLDTGASRARAGDRTYSDDTARYIDTWSTNTRYRGKDWSSVENDFRTDWERDRPGTWERFKDSIRSAWEERSHPSTSSTGRSLGSPETGYTGETSSYIRNWAANSRYQGRDWNSVENDFRTDWERERPGTWERFKDKIRSEWEEHTHSSTRRKY